MSGDMRRGKEREEKSGEMRRGQEREQSRGVTVSNFHRKIKHVLEERRQEEERE